MPGIRRKRMGRGFTYVGVDGQRIRDREEIKRIKALVIPPGWTDVWICRSPNGHIQATARDGKTRKQYRYHPLYREIRDETKFGQMLAFSEILPLIRKHVERDLSLRGLRREKVLATVVWLLEKTLIRVGNDESAREGSSFGLTTLRGRHVQIAGSNLRFEFRGKSGVMHSVAISDRRVARIVQRCQTLPGEELFKYLDEEGWRHTVDSGDINAYLRKITGKEITAKDFRTWAGTMLAATALRDLGPSKSKREAKSNIVRTIDQVAKRLGNTRAVCRKYYVHPAVIDAYMKGIVMPGAPTSPQHRRKRASAALRREEKAVLEFLRIEEKGRKKK
jgi:DNA topoisomerase-1